MSATNAESTSANLMPSKSSGKFLGFPLEGFGFFTSLLLTLASGFITFFAVTTIAIFALLAWNLFGNHNVNYADSYLYAGFPAGVLALFLAAIVFGVLWFRATFSSR
jgi:hypothetical protein